MSEDHDIDPFWEIQLTGRHNDDTTWLAPQEREGLNFDTKKNKSSPSYDGDDDEDYEGKVVLYEWSDFPLPFLPLTLNIRSIKTSVSLMESHVGEELWDAAKLFCILLCMNNASSSKNFTCSRPWCQINVRDKCVLELGAGCGLLGICCAALGAKEVLCTDYLPDVMDNLAFNVKHYLDNTMLLGDSWIKCGVMDWREFLGSDMKEVEWVADNESFHTYRKGHFANNDDDVYYSGEAATFDAQVVIGSALVYSAQGAIYCADTIYHCFKKNKTEEVSTNT